MIHAEGVKDEVSKKSNTKVGKRHGSQEKDEGPISSEVCHEEAHDGEGDSTFGQEPLTKTRSRLVQAGSSWRLPRRDVGNLSAFSFNLACGPLKIGRYSLFCAFVPNASHG